MIPDRIFPYSSALKQKASLLLSVLSGHSNETSMLERKENNLPKEAVRLFIVLFISLSYASAPFTIHLCQSPFHSSTFQGIICGRQWGSFAVLYKFELTLSPMGQTIGNVMAGLGNFREHFPYFFS